MLNFQPLRKEDKPVLDEYFLADRHENSHLNFTTLYTWRTMYAPEWAVADGVLYVKVVRDGRVMLFQPLCAPERLVGAMRAQQEYMASIGAPFAAIGVERAVMEVYTATLPVTAESSRDDADYVYALSDLRDLPGRRFHTKKNHANSFWRDYPDAEYLPITADIADECKLNLNAWYKAEQAAQPDDPYLPVERAAVMEILSDFDHFKLRGGALRVGKRIVAFTFGERLNSDTAVVHVEKAAGDVRGAFAAINAAYAADLAQAWPDLAYVNRQEDMGLPGLRQAKESYRPVRMVEKYMVTG